MLTHTHTCIYIDVVENEGEAMQIYDVSPFFPAIITHFLYGNTSYITNSSICVSVCKTQKDIRRTGVLSTGTCTCTCTVPAQG